MNRRHYIPQLLLAVLTVLVAVSALIAVSEVPGSGSIVVANATAATFGSPYGSVGFDMDLTSSVSSGHGSGVISQERAIQFVPPSKMIVYQLSGSTVSILGAVPAAGIDGVIESYAAVTGGSATWVAHGSTYTRTEPLNTFSERVENKPSDRGTVHETADVRSGQLVYVNVRASVPKQTLTSGARAVGGIEGETFALLKIGSKTIAVRGN
ncbi:MAG TPA: hypothetical protein VGG38_14970 [Acidimicrobiales bacterium]|jgi:hypothetical protein